MGSLGSMLVETSAAWLRSLAQCCGDDEAHHSITEKPIVIYRDQPALIPPPSAQPIWADDYEGQRNHHDGRRRAAARNGSRNRSASRGSFSGRRRWFSFSSSSTNTMRRPLISAPSNFRHVYSESFQFPAATSSQVQLPAVPPAARPPSFHPLELSIHQPGSDMSSMIPLFEAAPVTPPQPAHMYGNWDGNSTTLTHERSVSSISFHLPRRQARDDSSLSQQSPESTPPAPRIPPRSRARAYTSPNLEGIVERIASAMIVKERLEAEIESVIERQSLYINSRPTTPYGPHDLEPMPSVPALPASAPSFAERLSTEAFRPRTAPLQTTGFPRSPGGPITPVSPINISPVSYTRVRTDSPLGFRDASFDRPLAPPLPLVLRPPLRKKKSFSRVSSWLLLGSGSGSGADAHAHELHQQQPHGRGMSLDSVTNQPRPVTDREGFYQVMNSPDMQREREPHHYSSTRVAQPNQNLNRVLQPQSSGDSNNMNRSSFDTVSTVSSWDARGDDADTRDEDDEEEQQTVPTTTWSPASSPAIRQAESPDSGSGRRPVFMPFNFAATRALAASMSSDQHIAVDNGSVMQMEMEECATPRPLNVNKAAAVSESSSAATLRAPEGRGGSRPQSVGVAF